MRSDGMISGFRVYFSKLLNVFSYAETEFQFGLFAQRMRAQL
jgi:hypothetical protein